MSNGLVLVRDKAAMEQCHHSGCVYLALHCLLVCHAPHWLGRVRLWAPQDLLHSGLQQGGQVWHTHIQSPQCYQDKYIRVCVPCPSLGVVYTEPFVNFSLHRNYVSFLIPMAIFNMAIQVFVVMSSYQSIAQKFKKTGNPRVSKKKQKSEVQSDGTKYMLQVGVAIFCFHIKTKTDWLWDSRHWQL